MAQNQFSMDLNLKAYPNRLTSDVDTLVQANINKLCAKSSYKIYPLKQNPFHCHTLINQYHTFQ